MKKSRVIEHDFSKKWKARGQGVNVLIHFWRSLSRDGQLSVLVYALQEIGAERLAKREGAKKKARRR